MIFLTDLKAPFKKKSDFVAFLYDHVIYEKNAI